MNPQPFALRAPDGRELAAHWFGAARRRGVIVFNGATGFPQSFYFKLAQYAAERGYDVLLYDYRGMGLSAPADLAAETTRMSDWGLLDMRAALDAAAARAQGLPVVDARTQRRRAVPRAAHESRAGARARADRDLGRLLALGTRAFQVSRVVVLARARAADARAQGLHSDRRWLGRVAAAARRV